MAPERDVDVVVRRCTDSDFDAVLAVVNDSALAYRGTIPRDCWSEPYMSREELASEMEAGVAFWGCGVGDGLVGVMGLQDVGDVVLVRHAYVRPGWQRRGVGSKLLETLGGELTGPVLVGTWAAATWAIRFYQRHAFRLVSEQEGETLLGRYWSIPERQRDASVVLANPTWWRQRLSTAPPGHPGA